MERQLNLDFLRIIAAYAVVLLHTVSKKIGSGCMRDILLVYDGLVRWAVPVFVMISGALLLAPEKKVTARGIAKRILRMLTALWFWTAIYCIWEVMIKHNDSDYVLQTLITGYWHMWFIHMIVGLYILLPILRVLAENNKMVRYYLIIAILFAFSVSTFQAILPFTEGGNCVIVNSITSNYENMKLQFIMGYVPYFFLGYYLNATDIPRKWEFPACALCAGGILWTIIGNISLSRQTGTLIQIFNSPFRLPVLMQCIGLFVLSKQILKRKDNKTIQRLSRYTFGAYMVHLLFREALDYFFSLNAVTYSFFLWPPLLALVIFILSLFVSATVNHIPGFKNYVV